MLGDAYVAVHGGAGAHDPKYEAQVKQALKLACNMGIRCIHEGSSTVREQPDTRHESKHLEMVEQAISILEDDPHLNAGYGSNLTVDGTVECDAAVMDGRSSDFGSVGAVSGIKNPIKLARSILDYSGKPDPLGRIPPMTLTSEGARSFAYNRIETVSSGSLISPRAREEWKKWKDRLESSVKHGKRPDSMQDTVGAVAYHHAHGMAAGVSRYSGGILLKYPGRIGEAGVFGAGCWAQRFVKPVIEIACSVSGAGEYIVRTMLARVVGESINACISRGLDVDPHEILRCVLVEKFWGPCRNRGVLRPEAGILLLMAEEEDDKVAARLWCAFTTPSMAIAYASLKSPKPTALILRQPNSTEAHDNQEPPVYITAITFISAVFVPLVEVGTSSPELETVRGRGVVRVGRDELEESFVQGT